MIARGKKPGCLLSLCHRRLNASNARTARQEAAARLLPERLAAERAAARAGLPVHLGQAGCVRALGGLRRLLPRPRRRRRRPTRRGMYVAHMTTRPATPSDLQPYHASCTTPPRPPSIAATPHRLASSPLPCLLATASHPQNRLATSPPPRPLATALPLRHRLACSPPPRWIAGRVPRAAALHRIGGREAAP